MKKISFLAIVVLATTTLFAQDPKFGLKAGLNLATVSNAGGDLKVGFHGGALAHVHLTPAFSLQPEIMYSTQGTKYTASSKLLLNYIDVPLLLQYNFDNGFRLQGGPQIGFLIEAKRKIGNTETDESNNWKSIDISLPLGFSYLGYSGFGVDARYNLGITNIRENSSTNYRNSVFQFGLFYLLDHHHKVRSK